MEYWMYFFWIYCFVGASKTALALMTFPTASHTAHALHKEAGISEKVIFLMNIFTFIVTVCLSFFLWWMLLYKEGWMFFTVYTEEDVVSDIKQSIREEL